MPAPYYITNGIDTHPTGLVDATGVWNPNGLLDASGVYAPVGMFNGTTIETTGIMYGSPVQYVPLTTIDGAVILDGESIAGVDGSLNASNINTALGNGQPDATGAIIVNHKVIGDLTGTFTPTGSGGGPGTPPGQVEGADVLDDIEGAVLDKIADKLRKVLTLSEAQCYVTSPPMYIEGQDLTTIQVTPGEDEAGGEGDGMQDGGEVLLLRMQVVIVLWLTTGLDEHNRTTEAIQRAHQGMMALRARTRAALRLETLGGMLAEPAKYLRASSPAFYDPDSGVIRSDLAFSVLFAEQHTNPNDPPEQMEP